MRLNNSRKFLLTGIFVFCVLASFAQRPKDNPRSPYTGDFSYGKRGISEVRFEGVKNNNRINYSDIHGSPFWKPDWQTAMVYIDQVKAGNLSVRINFATNEVHFVKNFEEQVVTDVNITKLVFDNNGDSVVFINQVPDLFLNKKKLDGFIQVMNPGEYQLLKHTARKVYSADSLLGTQKRYFFTDEFSYFLKSYEKIERVKKLDEENFMPYIPSSSLFKKWISESGIDFKKEEDVIRFLNYYNSQRANRPAR